MSTYRVISGIQAIYYLLTGIWPVAHMSSFVAATGNKTDLWLVEMVGLLAASVGAGLTYAVVKNKFDRTLLIVLIAAAASFFYIDTRYAFTLVISFVYLPDAVCQLVFLIIHIARIRRS